MFASMDLFYKLSIVICEWNYSKFRSGSCCIYNTVFEYIMRVSYEVSGAFKKIFKFSIQRIGKTYFEKKIIIITLSVHININIYKHSV